MTERSHYKSRSACLLLPTLSYNDLRSNDTVNFQVAFTRLGSSCPVTETEQTSVSDQYFSQLRLFARSKKNILPLNSQHSKPRIRHK